MSEYWQAQERMTVPGNQSTTFSIAYPWGCSRMTVWAIAPLNLTITLQPQINGINFGSATTVTGAPLADLVFSSGGSSAEDIMMPALLKSATLAAPGSPRRDVHPFNFTVLVTNGAVADADLTLYACARLHTNG